LCVAQCPSCNGPPPPTSPCRFVFGVCECEYFYLYWRDQAQGRGRQRPTVMARCGDAGLKHELHCQCRRAQWHATRTENNEGARFAKARHAAALKERLERNSASNLWEGKIFRSKKHVERTPERATTARAAESGAHLARSG